MGKEKKSKEFFPPKVKNKSIVKRALKIPTKIIHNNLEKSHGIESFVASGSTVRRSTKCQKTGPSIQKPKSQEDEEPPTKNICSGEPTLSSNEDVMEWEPTEIEIIQKLHEIRREFSTTTVFNPVVTLTQKFEQSSSAVVHIVIDTNIFLSHLPTVKLLVEDKKMFSKVQIYIPWMVLQELDYMKTNRDDKMKLELVARKAALYIFEQISKKNPFFRIQSLDEFKSCLNLLPDENADDKILQWCLHLKKEMLSDIMLLSNDVLFCTKASASGIQAFQSDKFMQQLPRMVETVMPVISGSNAIKNSAQNPQPTEDNRQETSGEKETTDAHSFLQKFEDAITEPLSQILEFEMKQVFEDIWLHIVIAKPPWKFLDILRCIDKHWIAVFGYVYPRDMREKLDHLNGLWKKFKATSSTRTQKEREALVQSAICILQLMQRTRKQFYQILGEAIEELKDLVSGIALGEAFILDIFTRLWDRFNFICGTLSDSVGLRQHGLQYKPGATIPTLQEATSGLRMLIPLLMNIEVAMSRFFSQNSPGAIENNSKEMSDCLLSSINELGLQWRKTTTRALSRALILFVSNEQHKEKMLIGLEQLRHYLQVLHSVSIHLHL